MNNHRLF